MFSKEGSLPFIEVNTQELFFLCNFNRRKVFHLNRGKISTFGRSFLYKDYKSKKRGEDKSTQFRRQTLKDTDEDEKLRVT